MVTEITERVSKILGDAYEVGTTRVEKNNGVALTAITVGETGSAVKRLFYLDEGEDDVEAVAGRIVKEIEEGKTAKIDVNGIFTKEHILKTVQYRIVGMEANRERINTMPHKAFLDMAAIYEVPVAALGGEGRGSCVLTDEHMTALNITIQDLDGAARKNLTESGVTFSSMADVLGKMESGKNSEEKRIEDCQMEGDDIFVVTNADLTYGAKFLLYNELWERLAESAGTDLIILPSSIHELIILKDNGLFDPDNLKEMVNSVNGSDMINATDVLTNSVYRWSRKNACLEIAG